MKLNYQARTKEGRVYTGQVEASSKEAAIAILQKHGLYVTILEESEAPPLYARRVKFLKTISQKDIVLFSRQLSIMFKSKIPLVEAIKTLADQNKNLDLKDTILEISEEVEGGTPFSGALSRYPQLFSPLYVSMVKAGEASGTLSQSLEYLAEHLEKEYHFTSRLRGVMAYPALILFVVMLVLILMIFFIIPQLSEVLEETAGTIPTVTQIVIASSAFLKKWGWLFAAVLVILFLVSFRYYRTKAGKKFFDRSFLKLPIIGPILMQIYLTRFAENLSTLISGGLPIAQALEIVGEIVGNTAYQEVVFETRDEVRRGVPISSVLARSPDVFPPVFIQMTLVGERTGTLDTSLMHLVEFYNKEVDRAVESLLSIAEPVLILVLGVIVAGLMLSILLPLYKMITF